MPAIRSDQSTSAPPAAATFTGLLRLGGLALMVALLIRLLAIEGFRIPSASMEQSLLPGDLVLVSKVHYGPRLPREIRVPMSDWMLPGFTQGPPRLPGLTSIQRGDVVVFTRPLQGGAVGGQRYFIKRVVGLPGDTVQIRAGRAFVNGERSSAPPGLQRRWRVEVERAAVLPTDTLRRLGAHQVGRPEGRTRVFEGPDTLAEQVRHRTGVVRMVPYGSAGDGQSSEAIYVPARGDTLRGAILEAMPYRTLWRSEALDPGIGPGTPPEQWVVQEDQYYVLGDNRSSSVDSRTWGFVPARHIVGRAVLVYASWDPVADRPRWDRWLTPVR